MSKILSSIKGAVAVAALASLSVLSHASPISIISILTGDGRPANPDNIIIDVSVSGDTTSNSVSWIVDINSPLHPNAVLGGFYFNVLGLTTDYSFSGFNPAGWSVTSSSNAQGSGSMDFLFEADDPSGPSNNVTNSVNLVFTMMKTSGNFTVADFLTAETDCSNDTALGCGQLGAHVRSLTPAVGSGQGDSGFALGNYSSSTSSTSTSSTTGGGSGNIPEPSSSGLVFLGLGLVAASFWTRRRASS